MIIRFLRLRKRNGKFLVRFCCGDEIAANYIVFIASIYPTKRLRLLRWVASCLYILSPPRPTAHVFLGGVFFLYFKSRGKR